MTGIVFLGGEGPQSLNRLDLDSIGVIVAADSGLDLARRLDVVPHVIIGDFDSVSHESLLTEYHGSTIERHNTEKDHTDAELAVEKIRDLGADEVILVGGGGGRIDHLFALACMFERAHPPARWLTGDSEIILARDRTVLSGTVGEMVSLFPLDCGTCRMRSTGLKWELDGLKWERGDHGISNEFTSNEAIVEMIEGRLLVVFPQRGS